MTKLKRIGTITLATVFVIAIIGYSFYQPFKPGEVLKAVPRGASSIHHEDSLEQLLLNPACMAQLNQALGAGNSVQKLLNLTAWENKAAPSEIAVAYIPQYNAWVSVSWVGWRSPWLRWKMENMRDSTLQPVKNRTVWPMWQYENSGLVRGGNLYFALTENLFLICLADGKNAMFHLLETYDRNTPTNE